MKRNATFDLRCGTRRRCHLPLYFSFSLQSANCEPLVLCSLLFRCFFYWSRMPMKSTHLNMQIEVLNEHLFLTAKPVVYLVNLNEEDFIKKKSKWYLQSFHFLLPLSSFFFPIFHVPLALSSWEFIKSRKLSGGKRGSLVDCWWIAFFKLFCYFYLVKHHFNNWSILFFLYYSLTCLIHHPIR